MFDADCYRRTREPSDSRARTHDGSVGDLIELTTIYWNNEF